MFRLFGFIASLLMIGSLSVHAAGDPGAALYGKWVDQRQQGGLMIEFTPTTMSFVSLDSTGQMTSAPHLSPVRYRQAARTISVSSPEGGGAFLVEVQDKDTIVVDEPGLPRVRYRRAAR